MKTIPLFGDIDDNSLRAIYEELQTIKDNKEITNVNLLINSLGGSLDSAISIVYLLSGSGKKINVEILGEAGSSAALLVCMLKNRGATITCHEESTFLIHTVRLDGVMISYASDMVAQAKSIGTLNKLQIKEISKAINLRPQRLKKIFKREKDYIVENGEKIKEIGLVNKVL